MKLRYQLVLLLFISAILLFVRLGGTSVYQVAEARNAECAREMQERGDWVVPVFNATLRTDKPALEYFAMMAAYTVGGVSEGSARFFSALCGLLVILATFLIADKYLGSKAAWLAALALLASVHAIVQFRLATPDPYLILCHTFSLYCFFEGWMSKKWRWWAAMYIFLGLAFLAKGPIGLCLPGLTMLLFLLFKRSFNLQTIARLKPWWGIPLFLLFAAPWYILVHTHTQGAWTEGFFLKHNIGRFSGTMGGHSGIFLLTFLFVIAGMLPFSVWIAGSIRQAWLKRREQDLLLFSLIAFGCVVVFYAVSRTKLINYTTPAYPFLALMTGYYLSLLPSRENAGKKILPALIVLSVVAVALPVGFYYWTQSNPAIQSYGWLAWCFIIFPLGLLAAWICYAKKKITGVLYAIAAGFMINTIVLFVYPYPLLDAQTPMRKAHSVLSNHWPVAAYQRFNDAFVFYARQPIIMLQDEAALDGFLKAHEHALVISDIKDQSLLQSRPDLQMVRTDHEVFSSHVSVIYEKKE